MIELDKRSGLNTSNNKDSETLMFHWKVLIIYFFMEAFHNLFHFPALYKFQPSTLTERYLLIYFFPVVKTTHGCISSFCFSMMY